MHITLITPGTGNFFCGNCVRDNALANALKKMGTDVSVVPLYLPMLTDENSIGQDTPIFFGGINVYLQQKVKLFRHTPDWVDRIFNTRSLLQMAAEKAGMTQAKDLGELTVSMLKGEEGQQQKELRKLIEWLKTDKPDLVCLSNVMLIGLARQIKSELNIPVICTMQGEDGFLDSLIDPYREESWEILAGRAKDIDLFIAVSRYYGDVMKNRIHITDDQYKVVYNGISTDGYEPVDQQASELKVGFLSRMCHAKGLETLVDAFIHLKSELKMENVSLHIGGSRTQSDEAYVKQLQDKWNSEIGEESVFLHPNLSREEKIKFLQTLNVLSVPATYGEAFGLYLLEALAAGVPAVQPRHAAFPELAEHLEGISLCEPDDPKDLAIKLKEVLENIESYKTNALKSRAKVLSSFSSESMAKSFLEAVQNYLPAEQAG